MKCKTLTLDSAEHFSNTKVETITEIDTYLKDP